MPLVLMLIFEPVLLGYYKKILANDFISLLMMQDVSSVSEQYRMQSRSSSKIDKEYTIIQKEVDRVT